MEYLSIALSIFASLSSIIAALVSVLIALKGAQLCFSSLFGGKCEK